MAIDYGRVPVWMDNVFDNPQRSPQLSFKVRSEDTLGSLEEVFEEETNLDTATTSTTEQNGYHRQRLVVNSVSGEDGSRSASRSVSSSCGSPGRQTLTVSNPDVTANGIYLSG